MEIRLVRILTINRLFVRLKDHFWIFLLFLFFSSCAPNGKYPYAIKDFDAALRPHLIHLVENGIVLPGDTILARDVSIKDLEKLSRSEHPILRAMGLRALFRRDAVGQFALLMRHLDDTAIIIVDRGEFGDQKTTVSDDMLDQAEWKTKKDRDSTVAEVLTRHNYLRSAYLVIDQLPPNERYYEITRELAFRPASSLNRLDDPFGFLDREYALRALARYKKPEDITLIQQQFLENNRLLSSVSFELMRQQPDNAYQAVLEKYFIGQFFKFNGNRRDGFTGFPTSRADPEDFIDAVIAQETVASGNLLFQLLERLNLSTTLPDRAGILDYTVTSIWEHPCDAYAKLRTFIRERAELLQRKVIHVQPAVEYHGRSNSLNRPIRWVN